MESQTYGCGFPCAEEPDTARGKHPGHDLIEQAGLRQAAGERVGLPDCLSSTCGAARRRPGGISGISRPMCPSFPSWSPADLAIAPARGLSLHPAGRRPGRRGAPLPEPDDRVQDQRALARGRGGPPDLRTRERGRSGGPAPCAARAGPEREHGPAQSAFPDRFAERGARPRDFHGIACHAAGDQGREVVPNAFSLTALLREAAPCEVIDHCGSLQDDESCYDTDHLDPHGALAYVIGVPGPRPAGRNG